MNSLISLFVNEYFPKSRFIYFLSLRSLHRSSPGKSVSILTCFVFHAYSFDRVLIAPIYLIGDFLANSFILVGSIGHCIECYSNIGILEAL